MYRITRPWHQIVEHYDDCPDEQSIRALGALARQITDSGLCEGLFAWTSMWDLCIAQTEVSRPDSGPYLRISAVSELDIEFRYLDTAETEDQWSRTVPWDAAWDRLIAFLDQLHWFNDLDRQSLNRIPLFIDGR